MSSKRRSYRRKRFKGEEEEILLDSGFVGESENLENQKLFANQSNDEIEEEIENLEKERFEDSLHEFFSAFSSPSPPPDNEEFEEEEDLPLEYFPSLFFHFFSFSFSFFFFLFSFFFFLFSFFFFLLSFSFFF